jgi:plasmid replication initiation protein
LSKKKLPLLPEYHEPDLFIADILDASPKSDIGSMTSPIFSLSTKKDTNVRYYESGDGKWVRIIPSVEGCATVHDRDIIIYCLSQMMAKKNAGEPFSRRMEFKAHDLLQATNRQTSGYGYELFKQALKRLASTQIETNITNGGEEIWDTFGLIDSARIVRETRDGRIQSIEITLAKWLEAAVNNSQVLTLHKDYFRLRKPLERKCYEVFRKFCGKQETWTIGIGKLQEMVGATSKPKEFKRMLKAIIASNEEHQHIPEYDFELVEKVTRNGRKQIVTENIVVNYRKDVKTHDTKSTSSLPPLKTETLEDAKIIASAKGYDVYQLEAEWRDWVTTKKITVYEHNKNFIKFVEQKEPLR